METHSYWHRQTPAAPLFPDVEWNKPEQRSQAGRLGIIGGNKLGFVGAGEAYSLALNAGVGEVRVLLPDVLRRTVPPSITDAVFAPSNPSGGLSRDAITDMKALGAWATGIVLIGDAGRNSETAIAYETFAQDYHGPLTVTRDAFDLLANTLDTIADRPDTCLIVSFAQAQKLFRSLYYPKILTFSMQLQQLVEALHKFTVTYPVTIATFHQQHIVVAHNGDVTTTPWENPMSIWRGAVAAHAASYWLWSPDRPLQAVTASLIFD